MDYRIRLFFFIFGFTLAYSGAQAQYDVPNNWIFGVQLRPTFPNAYLKTEGFSASTDNYSVKSSTQTGISFGAVLRKPIGKFWNIETGLNFTRRNYQFDFNYVFNGKNVTNTQQMTFVGYELPIQALVYVRLGKQWYMNASAGIVIDAYPSETETFGSTKSDSTFFDFTTKTLRNKWYSMAVQTNLGFEYRTLKKGYFYLGSSYHRPFSIIAATAANVNSVSVDKTLWLELVGGYFSVDLKYFFKDQHPQKRPSN
jgi:Outer membrane protein beta-barrel domain